MILVRQLKQSRGEVFADKFKERRRSLYRFFVAHPTLLFKVFLLLAVTEAGFDIFPVDHVKKRLNICCTLILVFQIVGVLPNI